MHRLSTPFFPPRPVYRTLEQIVERMPIFGYQLYFNDQSSTREIEENVNPVFVPPQSLRANTDFYLPACYVYETYLSSYGNQ